MRGFLLSVAILALMACGSSTSEDRAPSSPAGRNYHQELRGREFHADVLKNKDDRYAYVQTALSGYHRMSDDEMPARVVTISGDGCHLPKPEVGDAVHVVHIAGSEQKAPIHYISDEALDKATQRFINVYREYDGNMPGYSRIGVGRSMPVTNVVVTDREAPIFLILISQTDALWSLQVADGVNIRQLVAFTPGMLGVANLPKGTELHTVYGKNVWRCGIKPARMPQPHWSFVRNVQDYGVGEKELAENKSRARAFQRWMRETFDVGFYSPVEALHLSNALIGPMPASDEERIPYTPIAGNEVLLSPADYLLVASRKDFNENSQTLLRQTARDAAGGDLSRLLN